MGSIGINFKTLVFGLTIGLAACGKKEAPVDTAFEDDSRQGVMEQMQADYGLSIIVDETLSFDQEHNINRLLRKLRAERDALSPFFKDVTSITISRSFQVVDVDGKLLITIDAQASNAEVDAFFKRSPDVARVGLIFSTLSEKIGISFIDNIGLSVEEATAFSEVATEALLGLDKKDRQVTILVTDQVRVGVDQLFVDRLISKEDLKAGFENLLSFSKESEEMLKKFSQVTGTTITLQPGILNQDEAKAAITAVEGWVGVLVRADRTFGGLTIGRRNFAPATVSAASVLLVDFENTPEALSTFLDTVGKHPVEAERLAKKRMNEALEPVGIRAVINSTSLDKADNVRIAMLDSVSNIVVEVLLDAKYEILAIDRVELNFDGIAKASTGPLAAKLHTWNKEEYFEVRVNEAATKPAIIAFLDEQVRLAHEAATPQATSPAIAIENMIRNLAVAVSGRSYISVTKDYVADNTGITAPTAETVARFAAISSSVQKALASHPLNITKVVINGQGAGTYVTAQGDKPERTLHIDFVTFSQEALDKALADAEAPVVPMDPNSPWSVPTKSE